MTGEIIKSFLVGLGFGVDESELAKFNKAIQSAAVRVTALYASINVAAGGIVKGISDISEGFEKMGYEYRIIAPAINKALVLRRELLRAYSAAGINITKVVTESVKLNMSLAKTKFALEAIYKSVGAKFFTLLTKQSDIFRNNIYKNMPKIQAALERFVKFIFKAFEAVTTLGVRLWSILTRVYDFFVSLDKATDGWSTIILGVIAAWKLLNLEFLATPLGMIITGLIAILALFDDFKTWQEGGKSLFDWTSFVPVINAVTDALTSMWNVMKNIGEALGDVVAAIYLAFTGNGMVALDAFKDALSKLLDMVKNLWESLKGLGGVAGAIGNWASGLFGGGDQAQNVAANIKNNPTTRPVNAPIGSNSINNAQTNQNVHQQTTITVNGSADAQSTGKAVASQQSRVNFDMVRNLKGATR